MQRSPEKDLNQGQSVQAAVALKSYLQKRSPDELGVNKALHLWPIVGSRHPSFGARQALWSGEPSALGEGGGPAGCAGQAVSCGRQGSGGCRALFGPSAGLTLSTSRLLSKRPSQPFRRCSAEEEKALSHPSALPGLSKGMSLTIGGPKAPLMPSARAR